MSNSLQQPTLRTFDGVDFLKISAVGRPRARGMSVIRRDLRAFAGRRLLRSGKRRQSW